MKGYKNRISLNELENSIEKVLYIDKDTVINENPSILRKLLKGEIELKEESLGYYQILEIYNGRKLETGIYIKLKE
ncbi:MAG: hypothetical protein B6U78_02940 [Candidatus Aenigmarchaeota archaeon ex4484_224]|nr:MAG: hypothetical protein B6U78_02940 [Candidatus Aenigmarchaeota archaeon ex4484_224]